MRLIQLFLFTALLVVPSLDLRSQPQINAAPHLAVRPVPEDPANADAAFGESGIVRSARLRQVHPPPNPIVTPPASPLSGSTPLSVPVLGLVLNSSQSAVRAIIGSPGAAQFTGVLPVAENVSRIHLPPRQKYVLVEQYATGPIAVVTFQGIAAGTPSAIPGAIPHADMAAFSPTGKSVVLYTAASDEIQVITGLPNTPRVSYEIPQVRLPEAVSLLAISDDGSVVVAGSQGNHVYLLSQKYPPQLLWSAGDLAAMAFYPNRNSVVVCDRSTGALTELDHVGAALTSQALARALPGLGRGINLQVDDSGKKMVLSNPSTMQVFVVDQSGSVQSLNAPVSPVSLQPLTNSTLFTLAATDGEPGLVLSLNSEPAQFFYVPKKTIVLKRVLKTEAQ